MLYYVFLHATWEKNEAKATILDDATKIAIVRDIRILSTGGSF
jgi:hypothetical protein